MTRGALVLFLVSVIFGFTAAYAGHGSYSLTPQKIADGVYVFWGRQEPPTSENGGNIVNTGFIVGTNSVLVVDTGPTQHYAKEMIAAIRNITKLPIHTAVVTHYHPDHSFGIQHFKKNNAATYMHRGLKTLFANEGPILLRFLEAFRNSLRSKICKINPNQINIKGKTTEKLGLIGKEEAIASEVIVAVTNNE